MMCLNEISSVYGESFTQVSDEFTAFTNFRIAVFPMRAVCAFILSIIMGDHHFSGCPEQYYHSHHRGEKYAD